MYEFALKIMRYDVLNKVLQKIIWLERHYRWHGVVSLATRLFNIVLDILRHWQRITGLKSMLL